MKIAVVDDDIKIYESIKLYLNELLKNTAELTYFKSGEEFLSAFSSYEFDLIILDIFMDKLTGMDVAREIRKTDRRVKIAFSTTSNEYASESYEVNACYYLHKPFGRDQIAAMLDRIDISAIEKMRTARLPDGTSVILRSIVYADCDSHCIILHCGLKGDISIRASFSEIERLLCAYPYFFSPTKGIVINFYEVSEQNDNTFKMTDNSLIPISRRKAKEVREAYSSFLFEKLRKGDEQ